MIKDTLGWMGLWLISCMIEKPIKLSIFLKKNDWERLNKWTWSKNG